MILTPLQLLPKNGEDWGKLIVAKALKSCPKSKISPNLVTMVPTDLLQVENYGTNISSLTLGNLSLLSYVKLACNAYQCSHNQTVPQNMLTYCKSYKRSKRYRKLRRLTSYYQQFSCQCDVGIVIFYYCTRIFIRLATSHSRLEDC